MQACTEQYLKGTTGLEERGACVTSMIELIKRREGNVQALQDWLISEGESRRALGTRLLTDVRFWQLRACVR
eukprot:scaffold169328_cov15-Tisochrysis_lutea.AAC.1